MPNRNAQDAILAKKYASARETNPKKRRVLRGKVRQLLSDAIREDQRSAELRYRLGYFLMDEGEYNKAIQYFEKALEKNGLRGCTMPLTQAQLYKAHMYIGYCGGQILKSNLEKARELGIEDASIRSLQVDGRGVDEVFELLINQSEYYYVIERRGQEIREKMISVEEYKSYLDEPTDCVLFSFVEQKPFLMYADEETIVRLPIRVLVAGVTSTLAMIAVAYGSSLWIGNLLELSFATSFLSTAPGGLDQMSILAAAVGADISVVTVFQLFRLLFIFLCVLPLLKWVCRKYLME